jgi:hypothetical protein
MEQQLQSDAHHMTPTNPFLRSQEPEFHFDARTVWVDCFAISYTNLTHFDCCICTGYNLWVHFRAIVRDCIKFCSVQKKITLKSGEDKEMLLQCQFEVDKEHHGSSFKYYPCAKYLCDKHQKWVGIDSKDNLTDKKTEN